MLHWWEEGESERAVGNDQGGGGRLRLSIGQSEYDVPVGPFTGPDADPAVLLDNGVQAGADPVQRQAGRIDIDVHAEPDRIREARQ